MDAEEFRLRLSVLSKPENLNLVGLVNSIVASEKIITTYKVLADVARKREFSPEESCVLDSARERLKLLYAELRNRANLYENI
jgi:hypothetical protein